MRRLVSILLALVLLAFGVLLDGCNQQSVTATLRSLQSSTNITFVCQGHTSDGQVDQGLPLSECPDYGLTRTRTLLGVVTQPTTNEIAVVDMDYQKVVDVNPGIPGYSFLRLPSRPGPITSTPGGVANFVGLTSPGKFGISAIPSTCLGAPRAGQHERDLTTLPACTLPVAPGDISVVVEPPHDGITAASCAEPTVGENTEPPAAGADRDCPANLTTEGGPKGRRKLVVTLPDAGQLAVIDAQSLLDRTPGSFEPCTVELLLQLDASPDTTGQAEVIPSDLQSKSCMLKRPPPMPAPANASSHPSRIAAADDKLYVSDLGVPAVHVLDSSSACRLSELPPLLPLSYLTPTRVVTTSRIAVSPLTPAGHQYVYAVDPDDQPASVMAFDVSPGVTDRTPIVREGSARQPSEIPDRIGFGVPVADIDFALRDLPYEDPTTGVAQVGVRCDPDPAAPTDPASPGVQYRTTGDYTQGARPGLLRGLFGLVMLTNGQVEVIDIDDFDATCRRNIQTNSSSTEDFRGCKNDTVPYAYLTTGTDQWGTDISGTINGVPTVSNEVSCNMVEPHRPRAGAFAVSLATIGLGAPTLRSLPQFSAPASVTNLSPHDQPKLLAVPFADAAGPQPAQVYVGTTLYQAGNTSTPLRVDPNDLDDQDSTLTLPLVEPRSYPSSEHDDLVYEGRVMGDKPSGFLGAGEDGDSEELADSTAFFCDNGVYDVDAMKDYAQVELGIKDEAAAAAFAADHADYVQVTGDFPSIIDSYWRSAPHGLTHDACVNLFGEAQGRGVTDLQQTRDLSILEAYQDHLVVTPRVPLDHDDSRCTDEARKDPKNAAYYCPPTADEFAGCFPGGMQYTVRGSQQWVLASSNPAVTRDIIADPTPVVDPKHPDAAPKARYKCVRDCDPRRQHFRGRAFEIGRTPTCANAPNCESVSAVGVATNLDGPCSYDPTAEGGDTRGVGLDEAASACIFENLTARFAVYRGLQPSVRDMSFSWDTTGGFYPLAAPLSAVSTATLPQTVRYIPEYQSFAVVDASALGVSLIGLDTLRVLTPWPVY
jgi:hypothetical protein